MATVSVQLEGNTITSNYGYGVSYRTRATCKKSFPGSGHSREGRIDFEVPARIMAMTDNTITNNGLAFSSSPCNADHFVENRRRQKGLAEDDRYEWDSYHGTPRSRPARASVKSSCRFRSSMHRESVSAVGFRAQVRRSLP